MFLGRYNKMQQITIYGNGLLITLSMVRVREGEPKIQGLTEMICEPFSLSTNLLPHKSKEETNQWIPLFLNKPVKKLFT